MVRSLVIGFVIFLVVGNLAIVAASAWARTTVDDTTSIEMPGVPNFRQVDSQLWRGAAPSPDGYRSLAEAGARTIVDLRAEENLEVDEKLLDELGLRLVALPMRDGQTPGPGEVDTFLEAIDHAGGPVFVHCGAGVGRTGAMAAVYLTATGQADGRDALKRNLAVGPPSLEQIAFAAQIERGDTDRPSAPVVAASRVLDAPRRLWSRYGL